MLPAYDMMLPVSMFLPSPSMKRFAICSSGITALFLSVPAHGATFLLNPTQDAFVSSANATSNYGGAGAVGAAAAALANGEFDSVLQFNLSAAKASFDSTFGAGQWTIDGMTLQLTAAAPNNSLFNGFGAGPSGTNINFAGQFAMKWMQNDSWTEGNGTPGAASTTGGITFSTLPSFLSGADQALGNFAFSGATSGNATITLALASSLLADATAGNPVSMLMLPADNSIGMLVNSRTATAANRPVLTVSAVPEPGTTTLLAGAVLAGLLRRRRHARAA